MITNSERDYLITVVRNIEARVIMDIDEGREFAPVAIRKDMLPLVHDALVHYINNHQRSPRCSE